MKWQRSWFLQINGWITILSGRLVVVVPPSEKLVLWWSLWICSIRCSNHKRIHSFLWTLIDRAISPSRANRICFLSASIKCAGAFHLWQACTPQPPLRDPGWDDAARHASGAHLQGPTSHDISTGGVKTKRWQRHKHFEIIEPKYLRKQTFRVTLLWKSCSYYNYKQF